MDSPDQTALLLHTKNPYVTRFYIQIKICM